MCGGKGACPLTLPITHTDILCWSNNPHSCFRHPIPPTNAGEECRDGSTLTANLVEPGRCLQPAPPPLASIPPHRIPATSPLPHPKMYTLKIQKHAGLLSKCTSTGSCPVRPRHTKARWVPKDGGWGVWPPQPCFQPGPGAKRSGSGPGEHGGPRKGAGERGGDPGSLARSRDLGLAGRGGFVITIIVFSFGKEEEKGKKKKMREKNNSN